MGHADECVVRGLVSVWMVLAENFPDDARAFLVGFVVVHAEFVHGVEHSAMDGFESVAYVGERAADDDAHRVSKIGLFELLFDDSRDYFLPVFRIGRIHFYRR